MVSEGAFGQLKGRWRVLLRRCECSQENTKKGALACVLLHNICLEKGDTITKGNGFGNRPQNRLLKANTEHDHLNHHSAIRTCLFVIF